jgi:thioesterase domain-containing protein
MSLVTLRADSGATPIFLVHGVGGTVLSYRELAARVGRPCLAIEARGIDGQEEPLDCIEALAAAYIDEVQSRGAPAAWLLGGWSFGGLVAFEMSVQLARASVPVCAALLDSRGLAERRSPEPPATDVIAEASSEVGGHALEALRATAAAHVFALRRYRPGRTRAPLLVVRATETPGALDDALGFAALAEGPLDTLGVPASHEGLLEPPAVDLVARALASFFARWDRG